jgi:hypothetical protein
LVTCRLEPVVRSKGPSFHDALDPLRRAVRQRGRVFSGAAFAGGCPGDARGLAPYTTSPLTPRHPPNHASAIEGQFACVSQDRDRFPRPDVNGTACHDPRCLPPLARRVRSRPPPAVSCDGDEVVEHELAARSAFRHACGNDETKKRSLQPDYDARARPTELRSLSRAGAVARYAFRRRGIPLRQESHADLRRRSERVSRHAAPLTRCARFGVAPALAFATSPHRTCRGATCRVTPVALRSTSEPTTS